MKVYELEIIAVASLNNSSYEDFLFINVLIVIIFDVAIVFDNLLYLDFFSL